MEYSDEDLKKMLLDDLHEQPSRFGSVCGRISHKPDRDHNTNSNLFTRLLAVKLQMIDIDNEITFNDKTKEWEYSGDDFFYGQIIESHSFVKTRTLLED